MALDPRIPLGVQAPQQQTSPLELISAVTQLQGLREQNEARRLAADAARQKAMDDAAIRRVMQESGGDWEKALPQLRQIAPSAAAKLETDIADARNKTFEGLTKQTDLRKKQIDIGVGLLSHVTDDASYQVALPMIATMSPDIAQQMGPTYDPARVEVFRQAATSAQDSYQRQKDALEAFGKGDHYRAVAGMIGAIRPEEGQAKLDGILAGAKQLGVSDAILQQFPRQYSPETVQWAQQQSIEPAKREELKGQAETRAQTKAYQDASLAISRGQLGVAQGHLAVAQAKEKREAAGGAAGVKLSPTERDDMTTMMTVQQLGQDALTLGDKIKWSGTGPWAGRVGEAGTTYFGTGSADEIELRSKIGNIQGTIAKLRGGTSFTPNEQALLDRYTPKVTDSEVAIKAKMKGLDDFITKKRDNMLRVASGQYTPPTTPQTKTKVGRFEIEVR